MLGQTTALRPINPGDKTELERLREIDRATWAIMVGELRDDESLKWFAGHGSEEGSVIFGIDGLPGVVSEAEAGKLQGWVQFCPDEAHRVEGLVKLGILEEADLPEVRVMEISYAKWPGAVSKQIAKGVRQACLKLAAEAKIAEKSARGLIITGYVDPANMASIKVLEACGFEKRGQLTYKEGAEVLDDVYILNGEKLKAKVDGSAGKLRWGGRIRNRLGLGGRWPRER